jgi:hypothetical protein
MSVGLPNNSTLHFCLSVSTYRAGQTEGVHANPLPTYNNAFLGNTNNGSPFYTGVDGDPALYSDHALGLTATINFQKITVVTPSGLAATGWEVVSADAESTDNQETIQWISNTALNLLPNSPGDNYGTNTYGCTSNGSTAYGSGVSGVGTDQLTVAGCTNGTPYTGTILKNGTAMVWALQPSSLSVSMVNYEAITFGILGP